MREHGPEVETHLSALSGVDVRHLVWIKARLLSTGLVDPAGFWNGLDAREFVVGGETRVYQGAGTLLEISPIIGEIGVSVRMQKLSLSRVPPAVMNLINLYELRFAPIEVHRVYFDPVKGVQIGVPARVLKGAIDSMPVPTAADGGSATVEVTVASAARALTRKMTTKKSDATQRIIDPDDRGREYGSISGAVGVFWGTVSQRSAVPPPTATPAPSAPKKTGSDK